MLLTLLSTIILSVMSAMPTNVGTTTVSHQDKDSLLIERAVVGYDQAMQHNLDSVVESSIYNSMVLSIEAPEADLSAIEYRLKELSVVHQTASIRMKAFLALEFLTDQEFRQSFTSTLVAQPQEESKVSVFRNLSEQLIAKSSSLK